MTVKKVREVRYNSTRDVVLSFAFLLIVSYVLIITLPHLLKTGENKLALFLIILAESEAIGIFILFLVFYWLFRSYEFFLVSIPLLAPPSSKVAEKNLDRFIEGVKYSTSDFGPSDTLEKYDHLDQLFSSRKSRILFCEGNFVIYFGYSVFPKTVLKIGVGFRPLKRDASVRNSFINKLESLAQRFEPEETAEITPEDGRAEESGTDESHAEKIRPAGEKLEEFEPEEND